MAVNKPLQQFTFETSHGIFTVPAPTRKRAKEIIFDLEVELLQADNNREIAICVALKRSGVLDPDTGKPYGDCAC